MISTLDKDEGEKKILKKNTIGPQDLRKQNSPISSKIHHYILQ
jgi:hypothetical protein